MSEPDEDGWVQETWESEEDMIRDFSLLPPYSVPSQSGKHLDPAPVPDTILQYRKLMAENQQKILDSEGDKNVSYLSSPGIGIDKRIIRSKITIDSHPSNDVELSKNIPEVSEKRYSSGMTEESTKAKIYESKSNSAISNFVDDEWVQETWESEDDIKRDLASLTQVDSKSSLVPDTILQYRKEMAKNKQKNLNSESYESVSHVRNRGIGIGRKMIWPKKPIDSYVSDDVELLKNIPEVYEKRYSSGMMGESAKAEVYESKSNIAISKDVEDGWVQETWESEEDIIRDFSLLALYSVPSQSGKHLEPAPVPDTILQYRKLMAENQQKILDRKSNQNVSYLSSRGIGIEKRIIQPRKTIDSHSSDDVELSKNIPEVSEKRYSSGMTEESTKAKVYESKSNSAISNFVEDEWVQETWESENDIKRDLASLTLVDSKPSLVPDTILQYRKKMAKNKQKNLNSESYESVSYVRNRGIGIGRKMIWPKKPIDSYVSDDVELLKNIPEVYEKRYSSGMMGESAKAEVYESKSNIAISKDVEDGWVQETWESEEDIIRDFSLLALYSVPSQNGKHLEPAPVPDTILQYRKLMAENQQKILDRKSDQNVSYLSSRDIGIEKRIIQPRKTIDSHSSDDVELSKNILEVSGRRYLSGMAGESTKPMVYESKSNSAISKVVEDGRVQKTWKSKDGIKRDLAFLSLFDSESGFVPNTILQYRKKMSRNKQKNLNSESDESVFHVRKRGTEIGRRMIQPKKPIDSYLSDDVELSKNIPEVSQRYSSGMTGELIKAKIYESKSNSAISKVQKTWESKKDIKKDFASLVDFKPGPVPDTVIQYRKMMAENKQKILDSKSDQSVSYLSSPGIRIGKKIIRPKKTLECHFSDDVELSNIPEVSGMEYLSGPIKESEKAKTYKYKSNRAISKVVLPSSSSSDESSAENTSTKYFEPVDLNLLKDNFSPLE